MSALQDVTDQGFEQDVLAAPEITVVDFWAPWCGPCILLTPHLERFAESLGPRVRIVKMDVDSQPLVASRLKVRGLPVLIAFHDGIETDRLRGEKNPRAVERWLRALEAPAASEQIGTAAPS